MKQTPIEECEERLRCAQLSSDVGALERLLDDALVFTTLDGSVVGKRDDLALHRSGRLRISRMEPRDVRILYLDTVAVVNVEMEAEAVFDGVRSSGRLRYTRVWIERPEGWRVIAGHMGIVTAKEPNETATRSSIAQEPDQPPAPTDPSGRGENQALSSQL